jgi:hypothetical protein
MDTDDVRPTMSSDNRLALNRLALNRLALNRLALNRLALNRLAMDGLAQTRWQLADSPELLGTAAGREVLTYVVKCAMDEDVVMVGTSGGQTYEFRGLLGLAPKWTERALKESEQQLISGCLLAHVNAFGEPVSISLRSEGTLAATDEERRDYPVYEGTFFGQIFEGGMTHAFSCQGGAAEAALAHSEDRARRVCTDGTDRCEIISVGRCRDVCDTRNDDMGWSDCWADGTRYERTISVYLFADDSYGRNKRCAGSKSCSMETGGGAAAILDCNGRSCWATCTNGATCTIDGLDSKAVTVAVSGAHMGEVDCFDGEDCAVECTNGSSCDVECQSGQDCDVKCIGGASCDVDCYRNASCDVTCSEGSRCHVRLGGAGGKGGGKSYAGGDSRWGWQWRWPWHQNQNHGRDRSGEEIVCSGGSTCELECRSESGCKAAICKQGASCLLECTDSDKCEFAYCAAGVVSCGNGVVACGRTCP